MSPFLEDEPISVVYIDDDLRLASSTASYLESHGVRVTLATDARDAIARIVRAPPDAVLLEIILPGADGLEACRELRSVVDTPILVVTARGEESDRVVGLESGADDYIPKPFSCRELLARIRAHVRRARGRVGPVPRSLHVGALVIDAASMRVRLGERELYLTTSEFMLLRALAERAGHVLTREQLVDSVRGSADEVFERSIDVHVSHLRQKLGDQPRCPRLLKTVRGVGYMIAADSG
jgi:DNA-binding response OmpR family regulator